MAALTEMYVALTAERPTFLSVDDAAAALQDTLDSRRCLMVIDDVWSQSHLLPFLRGGGQCVRLVTARDAEIARDGLTVNLGELTSEQAIDLLGSSLDRRGPEDTPLLSALAERLGRWPLLLKLASEALHARMLRGDSLEGAVAFALGAFDRRGVTAFDRRGAEERGEAIARTLETSLDLLEPEERRQYEELAAFPQDGAIPLKQVGVFWGLDDFDTDDLAQRLHSLSLVNLNLKKKTVSMHPLIRNFLRQSLKDITAVEDRAADAIKNSPS